MAALLKKATSYVLKLSLTMAMTFTYVTSPWAEETTVTLNPTGRDIELVSLLKVSDSVLGEAMITITANNQVRLPKESTLALLKEFVSSSNLQRLSTNSQSTYLTAKDFTAAGLDLNFDMSTLECIIFIPYDASRTRQLSLDQNADYANYVEPEWISGYLNISVGGSTTQSIDTQRQRSEQYYTRLDSGFNLGNVNLEYEGALEGGSSNNTQYLRDGTRLNIDFASQGTRLVVGDMYNSGKLLQDAIDILGVGLTRDFTLIPTRNVRPKATQTFTLQRTSSVDVVIDGVVVQRLTLGAGSYNLNDIPLAQGNNDVELIITDSTGQEERVQFSVATGNDLLDSGEFEYSVMYGVPSERKQQEIHYLTEQKVLHGYLDIGVTPWLTLGVNGQSREQLYQYGGNSLIASSIGITELSANKSTHPTLGDGHAYRVAFDAEFDDNNPLRPQLSLIYEYQSKHFSGIRDFELDESPLNNIPHYASVFGSFYLWDSLRAALSVNYSKSIDGSSDYLSLSPSLSGPFFATPASWSARVNYRDNRHKEDDWGTTLTLSWPFGKTTRVVSRYASQVDQASIDYTYQKNIGNTGGVSAFASIARDRDVDSSLDMGINYTGNRFIAIADHTTRVEDFNQDNRSHTSRLELSSSVAFAGSQVTIGRPVREAFAIVTKHDSLADNRLAVDHSSDGASARVYSEGNRNALVPDLVAYNSRLLTYDVDDLPPGYDLGDGAFWLNPGYKRGYVLQVGSDAVLTIIGTLIDNRSKQPIPLVAGYAIYLGEQSQEPIEFFTNRNGLFAISGLRPGEYKLELNNAQKQSVTLSVDSRNEVLIRLGELYVD
ncbi:putative fimbrial Usher protein [Vibrio sinaloensis DSM 21326]|uniref:Putative fimbrial Usher protein n=2 Tax=Photobacterium sp. (strain ATCC 43367) TaxID=379097 RepID=E8M697_PHOS4|nr:putative fimbrial Usher protein [Vibrio sinaloensis DSM 21326]